MINKIKRVGLIIKKTYYAKMWLHCVTKMKKCKLNEDYKQAYSWRDKSDKYFAKQHEVVNKLSNIDL